MKKHLETIFGVLRSALLAIVTVALLFGPTSSLAAINTATWDISGVAQADATFELISFNAGNITLNKTAFLAGAATTTELVDGATVPSGTQVDFMLFVNNQNTTAVNNINIADVLNPAEFVYVPTFMRINTTNVCAADPCTPAERAALYENAVAIANEAEEAGDVAGYDAAAAPNPTGTAGLSAGNAQLDVTAAPGAGSAFALVFRVTVQ